MSKFLLRPLAGLYNGITAARNKLYDTKIIKSEQLDIPAISVGNITAGGTGKTPFTISLAKKLVDEGFSPAIITRGYKRKSSGQIIVSKGNGPLTTVEISGDEPYLMAQKTDNVVIIADKNRFAAGQRAHKEFNCDIVIADDAFQHRKLHRDANILLWDAYSSPYAEKVLPAGRLRENFQGLSRADMVVFTRTEKPDSAYVNFFRDYELKSFVAPTIITGIRKNDVTFDKKNIRKKNLLAFCGLGNPEQFFNTVKYLEPGRLMTSFFSDHHKYSEKEFEQLLKKCDEEKCAYLVTTEKDFTNIPKKYQQSDKLIIISISLNINDILFQEIMKKI